MSPEISERSIAEQKECAQRDQQRQVEERQGWGGGR